MSKMMEKKREFSLSNIVSFFIVMTLVLALATLTRAEAYPTVPVVKVCDGLWDCSCSYGSGYSGSGVFRDYPDHNWNTFCVKNDLYSWGSDSPVMLHRTTRWAPTLAGYGCLSDTDAFGNQYNEIAAWRIYDEGWDATGEGSTDAYFAICASGSYGLSSMIRLRCTEEGGNLCYPCDAKHGEACETYSWSPSIGTGSDPPGSSVGSWIPKRFSNIDCATDQEEQGWTGHCSANNLYDSNGVNQPTPWFHKAKTGMSWVALFAQNYCEGNGPTIKDTCDTDDCGGSGECNGKTDGNTCFSIGGGAYGSCSGCAYAACGDWTSPNDHCEGTRTWHDYDQTCTDWDTYSCNHPCSGSSCGSCVRGTLTCGINSVYCGATGTDRCNSAPVLDAPSRSPAWANAARVVAVTASVSDNAFDDNDQVKIIVKNNAETITACQSSPSASGGGTVSCNFAGSVPTCPEGTCTLKVYAQETDACGVIVGPQTTSFVYDITSPTTSDNYTETKWVNTDQTARITCDDTKGGIAVSGCNGTYYCIYDLRAGETDCTSYTTYAPTPADTYSLNVNVDCPAETVCEKVVKYYSTDRATNTEAPQTSSRVKIDKVTPEVKDVNNAPDPAYPFGNGLFDRAWFNYSLVDNPIEQPTYDWTISGPMINVTLLINRTNGTLIRTLVNNYWRPFTNHTEGNKSSEEWNITDYLGNWFIGPYTFTIRATDEAGNTVVFHGEGICDAGHCGNGVCDCGETYVSCGGILGDCSCGNITGDDICNCTETAETLYPTYTDCGNPNGTCHCGDGICGGLHPDSPCHNEDCITCPADCISCGNRVCEPECGEYTDNCPADCTDETKPCSVERDVVCENPACCGIDPDCWCYTHPTRIGGVRCATGFVEEGLWWHLGGSGVCNPGTGKPCTRDADCNDKDLDCEIETGTCYLKNFVQITPKRMTVDLGQQGVVYVTIRDPVNRPGNYRLNIEPTHEGSQYYAKFFGTDNETTISLDAGETKRIPVYFTAATSGEFTLNVIVIGENLQSATNANEDEGWIGESKIKVEAGAFRNEELGTFVSAPGLSWWQVLLIAVIVSVPFAAVQIMRKNKNNKLKKGNK